MARRNRRLVRDRLDGSYIEWELDPDRRPDDHRNQFPAAMAGQMILTIKNVDARRGVALKEKGGREPILVSRLYKMPPATTPGRFA